MDKKKKRDALEYPRPERRAGEERRKEQRRQDQRRKR